MKNWKANSILFSLTQFSLRARILFSLTQFSREPNRKQTNFLRNINAKFKKKKEPLRNGSCIDGFGSRYGLFRRISGCVSLMDRRVIDSRIRPHLHDQDHWSTADDRWQWWWWWLLLLIALWFLTFFFFLVWFSFKERLEN